MSCYNTYICVFWDYLCREHVNLAVLHGERPKGQVLSPGACDRMCLECGRLTAMPSWALTTESAPGLIRSERARGRAGKNKPLCLGRPEFEGVKAVGGA